MNRLFLFIMLITVVSFPCIHQEMNHARSLAANTEHLPTRMSISHSSFAQLHPAQNSDSPYELLHVLIIFVLGFFSGLSPTLMGVYTDIISEVARTTRQEMDVVIRSLGFCVGIFGVALFLLIVFDSTVHFHFIAAFFGFFVSINLLNAGLHSFNSYTKIDLIIKAKFITLEFFSVLKLGLIHGIAKFADSMPFFVPVMYFIFSRGSLFQDIFMGLLFFVGIVLSFVVVLLLAVSGHNLFRKFENQSMKHTYFLVSGSAAMATSVWVFGVFLDDINVTIAFITVVVVTAVSGGLIGFKRRIVY